MLVSCSPFSCQQVQRPAGAGAFRDPFGEADSVTKIGPPPAKQALCVTLDRIHWRLDKACRVYALTGLHQALQLAPRWLSPQTMADQSTETGGPDLVVVFGP